MSTIRIIGTPAQSPGAGDGPVSSGAMEHEPEELALLRENPVAGWMRIARRLYAERDTILRQRDEALRDLANVRGERDRAIDQRERAIAVAEKTQGRLEFAWGRLDEQGTRIIEWFVRSKKLAKALEAAGVDAGFIDLVGPEQAAIELIQRVLGSDPQLASSGNEQEAQTDA